MVHPVVLNCEMSEQITIEHNFVKYSYCCVCCGPDEELILDVVPREDGARNSD